ncbi:MAG: hypothetical protein QF441_05070 [Bacteriovoracaceae bacterium]|jgi:uncharacterized coiled-coil protein SlyX|nr:hypothetical protein [Bacteriovoracaceae bacterium]|tara:strand:- start:644 stop:922 length:279 start_codon:yes stop_codon:yes gene_type:complete
MAKYVKSSTDNSRLIKSLKELEQQNQYQKKLIENNNKQLEKLNMAIADNKALDLAKYKKSMEKVQEGIQWVENDPPALKLDAKHLLKKLDIL